MDYIWESKGNVRLPGIMMLGYVAAHSETLAMSVIVSKVCTCHCNPHGIEYSSPHLIYQNSDMTVRFHVLRPHFYILDWKIDSFPRLLGRGVQV